MGEDTLLELSVLDCDTLHKDDHLGTTEIYFPELEPGKWHKIKKKLTEVPHGELEFEISCTTKAEHLRYVTQVHFSHAALAELARNRAAVFRDLPVPESPIPSCSDSVSEHSDPCYSDESEEWVDK